MAVKDQLITDEYALYNGDCIEVMRGMPGESVHLSVYSPPFGTVSGGLYVYSSDPEDISNAMDYEEFIEHYSFCVREIWRLTMPGRMSAVHCMDTTSGNSGCDWLLNFPDDVITEHVKCRDENCTDTDFRRRKGLCGHGWFQYAARYHVWKEPLTIRNRTMMKSLSHKALTLDSTKCSMANADYLLIFRKKGENPVPVEHPTGLDYYAGAREMPADALEYRNWRGSQLENKFSQWIWRQYASAFWDDVRLDRVLPHREAKEEQDEKHVHPLQLDVIERALILWSNPGEVVLTPFMGVGSEVYGALLNGRKAVGIELKSSYYEQAVANCACAKREYEQKEIPLLAYGPEDEE